MTIDGSKAELGFVSHLECLNCGENYSLKRLIEDRLIASSKR